MKGPFKSREDSVQRPEHILINQWLIDCDYDPRQRLYHYACRFQREFGSRPQANNLYQFQWTKEEIARFYADIAYHLTVSGLVQEDDDHRYLLNAGIAVDLYRQELMDIGARTMTDVVADAFPNSEPATIDKVCGHIQMKRGWECAHKSALKWINANPVQRAA